MKANTPDLMKFQRLQRKLGESRRGTIGLLEGLWIAAAKNCPQGDIGRFANDEIAILCDWDGDADLLINSLVECGWLDCCADHRLVIHDWADHCPTYVKGGLAKQRKEVLSAKKDCAESATTPEVKAAVPSGATSEVQPIGATLEVPSTKPSQAKPFQAISISSASASPVVGKRLQFPLKDGGFWESDQKTLEALANAFPSLNRAEEARKALAWLETNPSKRKTSKGMPAFLNRWFSKASERLSDSGRSGSAAAATPERRAGIYDPTNAMPTAEVLRARRKAREAAEAAQRASLEATA